MRTVLVFGVFDRLHPGHIAFLQEAKTLGDRLVVNIAQDEIVVELKRRTPVQSIDVRKQVLTDRPEVDEVIDGDLTLGTYSALNIVKPDIVAFGYDQDALRDDLERFLASTGQSIKLVTLSPHKPEVYKSSLL